MENYKELFESGNKAQLEKLEKNDHKTGWNRSPLKYFIQRIKHEIEELENSFMEIDEDDLNDWYENIRREAADVANFAHMIILKCDKKIGNK